jgi:hypothetical protein
MSCKTRSANRRKNGIGGDKYFARNTSHNAERLQLPRPGAIGSFGLPEGMAAASDMCLTFYCQASRPRCRWFGNARTAAWFIPSAQVPSSFI